MGRIETGKGKWEGLRLGREDGKGRVANGGKEEGNGEGF